MPSFFSCVLKKKQTRSKTLLFFFRWGKSKNRIAPLSPRSPWFASMKRSCADVDARVAKDAVHVDICEDGWQRWGGFRYPRKRDSGGDGAGSTVSGGSWGEHDKISQAYPRESCYGMVWYRGWKECVVSWGMIPHSPSILSSSYAGLYVLWYVWYGTIVWNVTF